MQLARVVLGGRMRRGMAVCQIAGDSTVNLLRVRNYAGAQLSIGPRTLCSAAILFEKPGARVTIGSDTFVGKSRIVAANEVAIGDDVLISWDVTIVDHDSHALAFADRRNDVADWRQGRKDWSKVCQGRISVGNKAWIGFGAAILKNVTIGEGAIVAAMSVVTKDVAPWTVVGGNPARFIRDLPHD